jgi:hypothetical protein
MKVEDRLLGKKKGTSRRWEGGQQIIMGDKAI